MTTETISASPSGSWVDDLPLEVESTEEVIQESTDKTEIINPPPNVCNVCGEPIVREPGKRGRLPKTHPECKAAKATRSTSTTRVPRASAADKEKEAEIARVLERYNSWLTKAIVALSIVDPYDALVLRINAPDILENLRALLWKYDKFRLFAVGGETGGSVFALIVSLGMTLLPIMAHHNLIPSKKATQALLQSPFILLRIQEAAMRSETGDFTVELLQRVRVQAEESRRRQAQKEEQLYDDASQATT